MHNSFEHFVKRKRKRKRHAAVDPCLGVYLSSSPPHDNGASSIENLQSLTLRENSMKIAEESGGDTKVQALQDTSPQGLPSAASSARHTPSKLEANEASVTVDHFLKTYADPSRPTKRKREQQNYARENRTIGSEAVSTKPSRPRKRPALRIPSSSPEMSDNMEIQTTRRRRHVRRGPLSDRLFQAAVMSHVDPIDDLANPPGGPSESCSRKPLQFVPSVDHSPQRTHRKHARVDPHRSSSIRTASFISARGRDTSSPSIGLKPITQWKTLQQFHGEEKTEKKRVLHARSQPVTASTRRPLTFVSVSEVDCTSLVRFSRKNNICKDAVPPNDVPLSPPPLRFVQLTASSAREKRQKDNSEKFLQASQACAAESKQPSFPESPTSEIPNTFAPSPLDMPLNDPSKQVVQESSHPVLITEIKDAHGISNNSAEDSPSQKRPIPAGKVTKPLSSFFDEFLETVRNATSRQAQLSPSHKPSVRRRISCRQPQEEDSCISFSSNACFNTSRFDEWASSSEVEEVDMGLSRSSDSIRPASPDILSILQPSPYQVTLSDSPSHATDTLRRSMASLRAFYE